MREGETPTATDPASFSLTVKRNKGRYLGPDECGVALMQIWNKANVSLSNSTLEQCEETIAASHLALGEQYTMELHQRGFLLVQKRFVFSDAEMFITMQQKQTGYSGWVVFGISAGISLLTVVLSVAVSGKVIANRRLRAVMFSRGGAPI